MAIKFGMTLAEIIQQFVRGFIKQTGRKPSGLDNIKIQQEALQRFKDMNKVVDMKGNSLNPAEGIMGGQQAQNFIRKSDPALYEDRGGNIIPAQFKDATKETDAQILEKLNKGNKDGIASMKSKLDDVEDLSEGTYSFGFKKGKEFQLNASSMGKGSLKEIIDSGELVGDDLDFAISILRDRKADGGRTEYYGGGQAMVGEDLSEIGHGSDALMARNMQIAPGGQATTSTGLNYLLGQDNDTVRVPYDQGGPARQNFKMGKRAFLKLLGAGVAGIAGLKTGLLGFGKKEVAKKAATELATSTGSGTPPAYFFKLVDKIKMLGDDVTEKAATADRQVVKKYKDYELTEDVSTGEIQIMKNSQSDEALERFGGENATEEIYMRYKPSEKILLDESNPGGGVRKTLPEYEANTSYISNNRGNTGGILDDVEGVTDDVIREVEAGSGNVPESFYTGINPIKKADGGRIGYKLGKKVIQEGIPALLDLVKNKFGKKSITTADKIPTPQKTLDRNMFKNFDDRNPEMQTLRDGKTKSIIPKNEYAEYSKDFNKEILNIPVQQEGKFTKAEYLIQRLENTIKGNPKDKYVQDTFPGFIDELKANPDLAKNENVFKELGGDLPEGQQIVVYGDDSVDFFTQKSGPGNIDRLKKLMAKHNISREKALKIMKMEPSDQVMEFKMLEVANRKLHAEGGRIGMLAGGGLLKALINNLAKERGMTGSELLKIMNWKNLPSKIKNLMKKEDFDEMKKNRTEGVKRWKDLMISQQEMTKNIDAGMNTPAAGLFKELEKTSPGYGIVPRNVGDRDILQMEQMIKNMETKGKGRKLNATGGLATMLGE